MLKHLQKIVKLAFFGGLLVLNSSFKDFQEKPQVFAVIIGVSNYSDQSITRLKFAHRDAEAYKNFLTSPKGGSVPQENIVLLTNGLATRSSVLKGLREMFNRATEEDVVIFYFSGHGVPDPKINTDLYLLTYDTDDENYTGTALLKDDVARQFASTRAKLKLFFADACHSGGSGIYLGTKDDNADVVNKLITSIASVKEPSWAAITAASRSEKSVEDLKWGGGHGVFTHFMIKGMEGEADKTTKANPRAKGNGDGIVTIRELYDYLSNVVPAETNGNQHPDKQGNNEDIFPVSAVSVDKFHTAVSRYKRPEVNATAPLTKDQPKPGISREVKDMPANLCKVGGYAYAEHNFINNFGEDLLLTGYVVEGRRAQRDIDFMVANGEAVLLPRVAISTVNNGAIMEPSANVTFFFRTIVEGKPIRYGAIQVTSEACKTKTFMVNTRTLFVSVSGRKY